MDRKKPAYIRANVAVWAAFGAVAGLGAVFLSATVLTARAPAAAGIALYVAAFAALGASLAFLRNWLGREDRPD